MLFGMLFSNVAMFFIILATGATPFRAGKTGINSAADAAQALRPLAGDAAGRLMIFVKALAGNMVLTSAGSRRKRFSLAIADFTLLGAAINFLGFNPMKALIIAGIVQGFPTPPLMLLIMLMTNNRSIMGERVNGRAINLLGSLTTVAIFSATIGLVITWIV